MSYNSTIKGWASAANSTFANNVGLNVTTDVTGARRRRIKPSGIVCFRRGWSGNTNLKCDTDIIILTLTLIGGNADLKCDGDIATGSLDANHYNAPMPNLVNTQGNYNVPPADWAAEFPNYNSMEFVNSARRIDSRKAGLFCDQWRRKMPIKSVYRNWVKNFFAGTPSCMKDCGISDYSASHASLVASMQSGNKLFTDPSFSEDCPSLGAVNCEAYYWPWSGCRADGTKILRYTISTYPANGGAGCPYEDGYEKVVPCYDNIWLPLSPEGQAAQAAAGIRL